MISLWKDRAEFPVCQSLEDDISADILVIGGGLAGLLCARILTDAGVDCVLLEAKELCGGVTAGTTAKITALHDMRCHRLISRFGVEKAELYYRAHTESIERFAAMCRHIDCEFSRQDAFVFSSDDPSLTEKEAIALNRVGIRAEVTSHLPQPFTVPAVRLRRQAQFDPLRFAAAIASGLKIYTHSRVRKIRKHTAVTDRGTVTAKKIIVATHFPFLDTHGSYFLKLHQSRSYVLALENAPRMDGMYLDIAPGGYSFRQHEKYLLMGGESHRTGETGGGWQALEEAAQRMFPGCRTAYRWAAQDCISLDGIPYIGRYSALTPDMYVATGFNKWGMTSSMVAAMLLADLISGRENKWAEVFSTSRCMLGRQVLSNIGHSAKNLLTLRRPRCTHLGCALKWNPHERTWDCPCHGSRFDCDGQLVNDPAQRDLSRP